MIGLLLHVKGLPDSLVLVVTSILSAGTVYVLLVIIYRLTFHPLAKYPGPWQAKITDLYMTWHAWKGDRHLLFWRCHERYGSVVRLGPNLLSFNTNGALKQIYGHKANVRKADFYLAFHVRKGFVSTHSAIDKTVHGYKRRQISHAFADGAIKSMEKYIIANIDTACRLLASDSAAQDAGLVAHDAKVSKTNSSTAWSLPKNMATWADWLTFDIMGDLSFGKAFGMLKSPKNRFAIELISNAARRHVICGTSLFIHNWHLDKYLFPSISAKREQYMAYSRAQATERSQLGTKDGSRKDFFHHLLNARDPETGQGLDPAELWAEANLFIIAGSDTTSTAIAATLFYLAHNPGALARASQQVRAAFAADNDTTTTTTGTSAAAHITSGPTLTSCSYLHACIDEAMRLAPPVAGALPRAVLPGGLRIDDDDTARGSVVTVPAGVDVCVPHYALHHNERYFPDAFAFRPERWLDASSLGGAKAGTSGGGGVGGEGHEAVELARSAFAPFSIGSRGCIGKGLAYMEMMLVLAKVLYQFDLRLAPGLEQMGIDPTRGVDEYHLRDTFTSMKDGPMLQFRPRQVCD